VQWAELGRLKNPSENSSPSGQRATGRVPSELRVASSCCARVPSEPRVAQTTISRVPRGLTRTPLNIHGHLECAIGVTNKRTKNSFTSGTAAIEELMSWSTPLVMSVVCRASETFDSGNSGSCVILSRMSRLLHT